MLNFNSLFYIYLPSSHKEMHTLSLNLCCTCMFYLHAINVLPNFTSEDTQASSMDISKVAYQQLNFKVNFFDPVFFCKVMFD